MAGMEAMICDLVREEAWEGRGEKLNIYTHGREVGREWKGRRHPQSVEEANLFVCLPNFEGLISPVTHS